MYKVINNRRYNTETAKKLGYWESDQDYRGLYHEEEVLYRNKAGNYFLYGYGGAGSKYSQQIGVNEWSSGESILPLEDLRYEASYTKITTSDYAAVCLAAADGTSWKKNMLHSSNTEVDQQ